MYDENYLAHYGILGMHWGIRRYQNKDGTYTAEGRKRRGIIDNARHGPSASKVQAIKAKREEELRQEHEARKKRALEAGSASDVLKFRGELTNQELQTAINRINYEKQLSSIAAGDTKSVWDKITPATEKLGKVVTLSGKMIDAWNTCAKVLNSFKDDDDDQIPIIGDGKKKDSNAKDSIIGEYMSKNGNLEQVLKYASQMSKTELTDALSRIASAGNTTEEKDRLDAIKNAIIDYGPDKKVFNVIDNWTVEDIQRYRRRKEKNENKDDNSED